MKLASIEHLTETSSALTAEPTAPRTTVNINTRAKMNFLEAQKSIIFILKLFGFFPYRLKLDGSQIEDSKFHLFYSVAFHVFYQANFISNHISFISHVDNYLGDNNSVSKFVTNLEGYTVLFCFAIIYYSLFFCKASQVKFLQTIIDLEQEIRALRFTFSSHNRNLRRDSIQFLAFQAIFIVVCLGSYTFLVNPDMFMVMMLETMIYLFNEVFLTVVAQFMSNLVITIGNLFEDLNSNLERSISSGPFHLHERDVKKIFELHDRLTESITVFNKGFGIQAFGIYIFTFSLLTFETYFGFATIFDPTKPTSFMFILNVLGNIVGFAPILNAFSKFGFNCQKTQEKVCAPSCFTFTRIHMWIIPGR